MPISLSLPIQKIVPASQAATGLTFVVRLFILILVLAFSPDHLSAQFKSVRVQVIDRGQADGILIRTPNQQWVVIDAGRDKLQAESMESRWGVDSVALAIVSHRHIDHYGGMDDVLKKFPILHFVMNMADCPNRVHDNTIRKIVADQGIPSQSIGADTLEVDGVRFIIAPPDPTVDSCPEEENDNSILVRMEFGEFSMLFTGDAETAEREWLMEHHPALLNVDVLKASHHGSINGADGTFNNQSWMDIVNADAVVLSAHVNSQHGHPHPPAVQIYEAAVGDNKVYCTSRQGTIRVYGRRDGGFSVFKQFSHSGSCAFGAP